jgi:hypothetical protein
LTDLELDEMQASYEKVKTAWTERHARGTLVSGQK